MRKNVRRSDEAGLGNFCSSPFHDVIHVEKGWLVCGPKCFEPFSILYIARSRHWEVVYRKPIEIRKRPTHNHILLREPVNLPSRGVLVTAATRRERFQQISGGGLQ